MPKSPKIHLYPVVEAMRDHTLTEPTRLAENANAAMTPTVKSS